MKYDLVLKGGMVFDPVNAVQERMDIGIREGMIAALSPDIKGGERVMELEGQTVIPGVIDMHVHVTELLGGRVGYYMAAKTGVTTVIDYAGPVEDVTESLPSCGCGLNVGCIDAVLPSLVGTDPPRERVRNFLERSLRSGSLGLKILGGHFPLTPQASRFCVEEANERRVIVACHAGSTENRSDILGFKEAVQFAAGKRMLMAHINAYCRGGRYHYLDELKDAFELLRQNPNLIADSHMAVNNGTGGSCKNGVPEDAITVNCLNMFGYKPTQEGLEQAIKDGCVKVIAALEKENILLEGAAGLRHWRSQKTRTNVSFPANLASVAAACIVERRSAGGRPLIELAATDGGGFPRNGLIEKLLAFYRLGYLTLEEVVYKCSVNPARTFGLFGKGHLGVGADADVTVLNREWTGASLSIAGGAVIMEQGRVLGSGGIFLTTQEGERNIKELGMPYIIARPEQGMFYGERK